MTDSDAVSIDHRSPALLAVKPDPISLGRVIPGQSATVDFEVSNSGDAARFVNRIRTSCPCVVIEPGTTRIEPGESARFAARYDPDDDPSFRGSLGVRISGFDLSDQPVFDAEVQLTVQPEGSPQGGRGAR